MSDAAALEESQLRNEMTRGEYSRELLDNPLINEFFELNEKEIWQAIKNSPARDVEGREKLLLMQQSMDRFKAYLTTTLQTGKMASMQMESKRNALQRAKSWIWND